MVRVRARVVVRVRARVVVRVRAYVMAYVMDDFGLMLYDAI